MKVRVAAPWARRRAIFVRGHLTHCEERLDPLVNIQTVEGLSMTFIGALLFIMSIWEKKGRTLASDVTITRWFVCQPSRYNIPEPSAVDPSNPKSIACVLPR